VEEVKRTLWENPDIDVDWANYKENGRGALAIACENGWDSIVAILLMHPDIYVNSLNGLTPFMSATFHGRTTCVRLLLKDSRVNMDNPVGEGHSPLLLAAIHGHLDAIKWWIASGTEMDLGKAGDMWTDAIGRQSGKRRQRL